MSKAESGKNSINPRSLRTILLRMLLLLFCVVALAAAAVKLYLDTPHAAALASRLLTSYLNQPAYIAELGTNFGSVTVRGISLGNPPDVAAGNLLEVKSLTIAPGWGDLLMGRRRLRLLAIDGLRLDLRTNKAGQWNFSGLQKRFSGNKPSGADLFVGQFLVSDGAVLVNGQGATGLSLQLANLSTKGSGDAQFELSFEDAARTRYLLSGTARPGNDPSFHLVLSAPAISFSDFYGMLNKKSNAQLEGVSGVLNLSASLRANKLQVSGILDFSRPSPPSSAKRSPLAGSLRFAAVYDSARDEARLDELILTINDLIRARAKGAAAKLKSERTFTLDIGIDPVELASLAVLLPEKERQSTVIGGSVSAATIHISGSAAHGVDRASGALQLRNGSLKRGGQLYFTGLGSTVALSRVAAGFQVKGKMTLKSQSSRSQLESLNVPFGIHLNNRLKLISAEMPSLSAVSRGVRVSGRLGFTPAADNPLTVALRASVPNASALQPFTGSKNLLFTSGVASLVLDATGRGLNDFSAAATALLTNLQGTQAGHKLGLKNGKADSRVIMQHGKLSVSGKAALDGMARDGRSGTVHFTYRIADDLAAIENARIAFDGVSLCIARLSARISPKEAAKDGTRYPLQLELSGGEAQRGEAGLSGVSATLRGSFASGVRGRWLDGTADLSAARVVWQGKPVATTAVHAAISRTDVRGTISGLLLGGTLAGDVSLGLSGAESASGFRVGVKGMHLAQAGDILPRRGVTVLADGTLNASIIGSYSSAGGLVSRFDLAGAGISITGSGGKTVLAAGGLTLAGELAGSTLKLADARFTAGEGLSLKLNGEVKNTFSPLREGRLVYSLQRAPLTGIIDPFVNVLPRFIQEATVAGSLASEGTLILHDGKQLLGGTVQFSQVLVEVSSQKFKAGEINGSLPFSLDLSGKTAFASPGTSRFTRENYPRLLELLRAEPGSADSLSIGSVSFGSLRLGEVLLRTRAAEGGTRFVSLRSSLYDGAVLGTGSVTYKNGINYRSDLLINGLSLKQFCATIPKIKDYISGRLDGVISLSGAGKGVNGITGFSELWVREGSGEKMLVSKTFLQKLSGKQLSGFFFRSDRPFDTAEIIAVLQNGDLTFNKLDISNTNLFRVRDLSVTVAPAQNRIALDHLLTAVKQAAVRGKPSAGEAAPGPAPVETEFKWQE